MITHKSSKTHVVLLLVIACVLCLTAGGIVAPIAAQAATPQYTFYFISHCMPADVFWAREYKGMMDACERYNIKGVYLGSQTSGDVGELLRNLETAIAAKPDGIACVITDPRPLDDPLRTAAKAGIPVVAVNVKDFRPDEERVPYLIYIGEDSYLSGAKQAERFLQEFKALYGRVPKKSVFAIHEPGNIVQEKRATGVIDVLKNAGVKSVEKLDVTYDPAKVSETLRAYIKANPDVESIHTGNILVAHWAAEALEEMGKLGKVGAPAKDGMVFVCGIDLSPEGIDDIMQGRIVCTIDQQPYLQGYLAMETLWLWKTYQLIPSTDIATGPYVVDKSNAASVLKFVEKGIR